MGEFIIKLLGTILKSASPTITAMLKQFHKNLAEKAAATDNPIDDILVALLGILMGID